MSVAQLQVELSKLTAEEKFALASYLVREAESQARSAGETALLAEDALAALAAGANVRRKPA